MSTSGPDPVDRTLEINSHLIDEICLREIVTASHISTSKNPQINRALWPQIAAEYVQQKNLPFSTSSEMKHSKGGSLTSGII